MKLNFKRHHFIFLLEEQSLLFMEIKKETIIQAAPLSLQLKEDLKSYIKQFPQATLTTYIDFSNQQFTVENLPKVTRVKRNKIISLRLKSRFGREALIGATSLKSQLLLLEIPLMPSVQEWLSSIESLPHFKKNFLSLPFESAALGKTLIEKNSPSQFQDLKEGWFIEVIQQSSHKFRVIVLHGDKWMFTRSLMLSENQERITPLLKELKSTLLYCRRFPEIEFNQASLFLLIEEDLKQALKIPLNTFDHSYCLSPLEALFKLKGKFIGAPGLTPLGIAAFYATQNAPLLKLTHPSLKGRSRRETLLKICASLSLLIAASQISYRFEDFKQAKKEISTLLSRQASLENQCLHLKASLKQSPSLLTLQALYKIHQTFQAPYLYFFQTLPLLKAGLPANIAFKNLFFTTNSLNLYELKAENLNESPALHADWKLKTIPFKKRFPLDHYKDFKDLRDALKALLPKSQIDVLKSPFSTGPREEFSKETLKNSHPDAFEGLLSLKEEVEKYENFKNI